MDQASTSRGEESGPLITGSSGSSCTQFQQQGTVDWVDLSKHTVGFLLDILTCLSASQVQPFAFAVRRAIGANFVLSPAGQQNVTSAVNSLKAVGSFGDVLWFGFGIRSLAKVAATTQKGVSCLALCAALSEGYQEDMASDILSEIFKLNNPPQYISPSLCEWRALL